MAREFPWTGGAVPLEPWVMVVFIHLDIDLPSFRDDSGLSIVLLRSLLMGLHPVSKHGRSITWTVKSPNNCLNNLGICYTQAKYSVLPCQPFAKKQCFCSLQSLWLVDQLRLKIWHGTLPSRKQLASLELLRAQYWSLAERTSPAKGLHIQILRINQTMQSLEKSGDRCLTPTSGAEVCGRMVSSLGRISSKLGIISTGHLNKMGYHQTGVTVNGQKRTIHVHRLVAAAFIGLPEAGCCVHVNHKDLDKGNNAAENLEYLTPAENATHFHALSSWVRTNGLKTCLD